MRYLNDEVRQEKCTADVRKYYFYYNLHMYAHIITTWVDETCVLIYRPGIDRNRESLAILNTERIHADVGITT